MMIEEVMTRLVFFLLGIVFSFTIITLKEIRRAYDEYKEADAAYQKALKELEELINKNDKILQEIQERDDV